MDSGNLWHKQLGHPSSQILSLLPKDLGNFERVESKEQHPCDICFRAKQTRSPFCDSESKAKDLFETIHCDIWGSYRAPSFCGAHYFLTIVDDFE